MHLCSSNATIVWRSVYPRANQGQRIRPLHLAWSNSESGQKGSGAPQMVFTYVRIACLLCRYNHPTWLLCTLSFYFYIFWGPSKGGRENNPPVKVLLLESGGKKVVGGLGGSLSAGGSWSGLETLETIRHQPFPSELWPQALTSECYIWGRAVFFLSHIDHAGGHWSTLISTMLQSLAWGWVVGGVGGPNNI